MLTALFGTLSYSNHKNHLVCGFRTVFKYSGFVKSPEYYMFSEVNRGKDLNTIEWIGWFYLFGHIKLW